MDKFTHSELAVVHFTPRQVLLAFFLWFSSLHSLLAEFSFNRITTVEIANFDLQLAKIESLHACTFEL